MFTGSCEMSCTGETCSVGSLFVVTPSLSRRMLCMQITFGDFIFPDEDMAIA